MKHFFMICLAMLHFAQPSHATAGKSDVENEIKNYISAQVVAYQPKAVGFPQFVNTLSGNSKGAFWHELIVKSRAVKTWPLLRLENGQIHFKVGDQAFAIEIAELNAPSMKINGQLFKLDPKKSYFEQSESFIQELKSKKAAIEFLIPHANAQTNDPASARTMIAPVIVGAVGGALNAIGGAAFGSVAPAMAVGAVGGAAVGAVACSGIQLMQHGETFWDRYLNCISAPLSLLDMNPRDTLRFKKFSKCSANQIHVEIESSSGLFQIREFEFVEGKLQAVKIVEPKKDEVVRSGFPASHEVRSRTVVASFLASTAGDRLIEGETIKGNRVRTELSRAQLEGLQGLIRDAELYKGICADPARKAKIESQAGQAPTPNQMKPSKYHEKGIQ